MNLAKKFGSYYKEVNRFLGGRPEIIREAVEKFGELRGSQAAAGMAYYAFFSLFPLMLVFVSVGSYFLEREQVYQEVINAVSNAIPVGHSLIDQNLQTVLQQRGTIGIIGVVTLLWSASGMFTTLVYNINLAWTQARRRNFLEKRLIAFSMIAALGSLLLLSFFVDAGFKVLANLNVPVLGNIPVYDTSIWVLVSNIASWVIIFLLFLGLYWRVPTASVALRAAFWSAAIAALAWQISTNVFSFYLTSGLGRYDIVYGSLGAVVALIFLIYILSWITLFGAHLCASIDRWLKGKEAQEDVILS